MTTDLKLYELTDEALNVQRLLDELAETPEGTPDALDRELALNEAMKALGVTIQQKAESIVQITKNEQADADLLDAQSAVYVREANALAARAQAKRNSAARLLDYLRYNLAALGDDTQRLDLGTTGSVTLAKRGLDALVVEDEGKLPAEFIRAKLTLPLSLVPADLKSNADVKLLAMEPDKAAMNAHFKESGHVPAGCTTEPNKRRLTVR